MSDREFDQYIAGKTVAIVGPAPPDGDQTDDIDRHDVVVRFAYFGVTPPGAGTRTDVGYYNGYWGRSIGAGRRTIPPDVKWAVFKMHTAANSTAGLPCRTARTPPLRRPNMVPLAAHDLLVAGPAKITIYGANFYLSEQVYFDNEQYLPDDMRDLNKLMGRTVHLHDQMAQRRLLSRMLAEHPNLTGDSRFLRVLALDDDAYLTELRRLWPSTIRPFQPTTTRRKRIMATDRETSTWAHVSDGRVRTVLAGSTREERYASHPEWYRAEDPDTAGGTNGDGGLELLGGKGGWWEIATPDGEVLDKVRGRDAAEARRAELAAADG